MERSRIAIIVLSAAGVLISGVLLYSFYAASSGSFCVAGSGCDAVRSSAYSSVAGMPVALLGVLGFVLILLLSLTGSSKKKRWTRLFVVTTGALAFVCYFTFLELFVIKAICPYCVASALVVVGVFVTLMLTVPNAVMREGLKGRLIRGLILFVVVVAGVSAMQYSGARRVAADSREATLARHLTSIGARMYGTYVCPHCIEQKSLFGDAERYIDFVDCAPSAGASARLCRSKGIARYPTWEIKGRFHEGTRSLSELERLSDFRSP